MLQLISAMEKEKLALEKKIEDEKTSASKSCDNDLYNVTLNKAKKLEKTKDKAEQDLAKSQVLLSSKTTELTNVKEKLKLADSKIKDLERELRLSPSALTDQTDEEKEELKRFVKHFFIACCMRRKFMLNFRSPTHLLFSRYFLNEPFWCDNNFHSTSFS